MLTNPFDYFADPTFWVLYLTVAILLFMCGGLFIYTVTIRLINRSREKKSKQVQDDYAQLMYSFLAGEMDRDTLSGKISSHSFNRDVFFEVIKKLKDEIEGDREDRLTSILNLQELKEHFYKKLEGWREEEIITALIYFREIQHIDEAYHEQLLEWIEDGDYYLSHGSASLLLSTDQTELHEQVLKTMCLKADEKRQTLIELLWDYWTNEQISHTHKFNVLKNILHSPDIELPVKETIVRSMAEFGYAETGHFVNKLLQQVINNNGPKKCPSLIVALISSIKRLQYLEGIPHIKKLLHSGIQEIEEAAIQALAKFQTKEACTLLQQVADQGKAHVLEELSFQLYRYPRLQEKVEIPKGMIREYSPNYEPMNIVKTGA